MGSFGADLKKAREAKGVTLDAIAAATKITMRNLQAIEQEQFDQLPGGVFRRSMVRGYARAANLDEDAWVQRYLETTQEETGFREDDQAWMEFAANVGRARGRDGESANTMARWAGVVALLLLVMGMGWFVWGYVHNKVAAAARTQSVSSATTTASASTPGSY